MTPPGTEPIDEEPPGRTVADRRRLSIVFHTSIALLLALAILAIYFRTHGYAWVTYDDDDYVYANAWVIHGLTWRGVTWAIASLYANWHPLTWISLMLDVQLFGLDPGAQHLVNVGFHLGSTVLLLVALSRLTGKPGRSAIVAAVFAVHPLHVESVAWISERKDVLSTFFEMLTLLAYASYARNRTALRYDAVALAFACALMAKPMAVTFPFVLLLLDYWPLNRVDLPLKREHIWPLVTEKAPLFVMSAIASLLTSIAQRRSGAVVSLEQSPFPGRMAHSAVAYLWYLGKAILPRKLAFFYPLLRAQAGETLLALAVLAAITATALHWRTRRPYFLVGWLWFLGTLFPVIGLVQAGRQGMADRYMYLPLTGLSIAFVWLIADMLADRRRLQAGASALATGGLLVLVFAACRQVATWQDSETLYRHALAVTDGNYLAENNLGALLVTEQRHVEAIGHLEKAIANHTDYASARINLGGELLQAGRLDEAFFEFSEARRIDPKLTAAETGLAALKTLAGNYEQARELLLDALRISPDDVAAHVQLCFVLAKLANTAEGISHCREAIRLKPDLAAAHATLAQILADEGHEAAAAREYEDLLALYPSYPGARAALERLKP